MSDTVSAFAGPARAAYAAGFALSGGPLTERVKTGCTVAVTLATEHASDPGILESTLRLGSLEGTWAAVLDRREKLYAQHIAAVTAAYRALTAGLDIAGGVRRFRRHLGLTEAVVDDTQRRRQVEGAASAEAVRIIHQTMITPSSPEYKATVTAITDALVDAEAEGTAGAIAIAAEQVGRIGIDFDLAFTDAHEALARLGTHWVDAKGWLGRIVNGQAADLGRALTKAAESDAGYQDMLDAASEVLDGTDIRAVSTVVDLAMGQSFSRGALTLYGREGVGTVDFSTAGGARVCQVCMDAESASPWARTEAPAPPLHPNCRCVLMPSSGSIVSLSTDLDRYMSAA